MFPAKIKWILAAVALAPKILFLGVRALIEQPGLSFTIEPRTLATSPPLWSWSILVAALGLFLICAPRKSRRALNAPVQPGSSGALVVKLLGLAIFAAAAVMLLGVTDDFQRIEDAGNGRWALKHAVRGAVATFTPAELESIEAVESRRTRGANSVSVRVLLKSGRTLSASTSSTAAYEDLRKFAATAGLRPDAVQLRRLRGAWTNGASGITLQDCVGTYEHAEGFETRLKKYRKR